MSLSASQVKGTTHIFKLEAQHLSPALGLIMKESNAFCGNLLRQDPKMSVNVVNSPPIIPGFQQGVLLSKELFFQRAPSEPPAITRSSSRPAFYLTPTRLGHVVGFALSRVGKGLSRKEMEKVLVSTGIVPKSTKAGRRVDIDGVSTNISLSRFFRLCELVSDGHAECKESYHLNSNHNSSPYPLLSLPILLILRFLWEKAISKQCLLEFYTTVNTYHPILHELTSESKSQFLRDRWSRSILEDYPAVESACLRLLSPDATAAGKDVEGFDIELVAASVSSANAHKPAIKLSRHGYKNAADKPDCVEVVIREIFDLLLYDSITCCFNLNRLPPDASPKVRQFYKQHADIFVHDEDGSIEAVRSKQWFDICCGLDGGVEYTASSTASLAADLSTVSSKAKHVVNINTDYELVPSLANVSKTMGVLLFGGIGPELQSLDDFATRWNEIMQSPERLLVAKSSISSFRAPMSDETVHREVGGLKFQNGHHAIEMDLERAHNLAITRHKRTHIEWIAKPKELAQQQWLQEVHTTFSSVRHAVRPLLLGDSMLQCLEEKVVVDQIHDWKHRNIVCRKVMEGWLSSRWGEDRRSMSTLEAVTEGTCSEGGFLFSSTDQQAVTEELEQLERMLVILEAYCKGLSSIEENCDSDSDSDTCSVDVDNSVIVTEVATILGLIFPKLENILEERNKGDESVHVDRGLSGDVLSTASIIRLAQLLCVLPPIALETAGLDRVTPLLYAMCRHKVWQIPLLEASRQLSFGDKAILLQFSVLFCRKWW
jgi:hypothetical protein